MFFNRNVVAWSTKKKAIVSRSSCDDEHRSLVAMTAQVTWIQFLLHEMHSMSSKPHVLWFNNTGAIAMTKNHVQHSKSKHFEIDLHFVRGRVLNKSLEVGHVLKLNQIADPFTVKIDFPSTRLSLQCWNQKCFSVVIVLYFLAF